ncbi:MAG: TonB-dependent receptor, partial [Proteobacteria bacterium]|nr:TonB-dependent receptor [Pseudomonadota bacterium]
MAVRARLSLLSLPLPALVVAMPPVAHAQQAEPRKDAENSEEIVVTAARTMLPPNALPLTIDVIDKQRLDQQIAISGSVTDAVANLTPSFSPTRQKLSGAGETLRGRSPLYAIN